MEKKINQVSIWSSFDNLIADAEEKFFNHDFDSAIKLWQDYAQITGAPIWQQAADDLRQIISDFLAIELKESQQYFKEWVNLRRKMNENKLSSYAYRMMQRLFAKIFLSSKQTVSFDIATGVFCFIDERYENAKENLTAVLNREPDNLLATNFLCNPVIKLNQF